MTVISLINRLELGQTVRIIETSSDTILFEGSTTDIPDDFSNFTIWNIIATGINRLDIECYYK